MRLLISSAVLLGTALCAPSASGGQSLPTVDLGYELHQAILYNSTGNFYNFSNIRYAEPPVGDLRFRVPQPPKGINKTVDNGSIGRICPQAQPAWELTAQIFVPDYLEGVPFNASANAAMTGAATNQLPPQDPRTTEDCLFLDVVVPQKIFNAVSSISSTNTSGAPVLVWIYGGGYTSGEKSAYSAAGLLKASQANGTDGVVFVSINYRLGAFGWLAGPTLQSDGVANAGLYDQRLALQWVQDNIHLFGGDPSRVTVIGESAGGGSIMHQITAFGGLKGPAPFQQAVLQSAAFQNIVSYFQQEQTFQTYLSFLNVSSLAEARKLPFQTLQTANIIQVGLNSSYGDFTFGPVVDGLIAPAIPGKLLLQGSFDNQVKLLLGHNADEGLEFTSPQVTSDQTLDTFIQEGFPTIQQSQIDYLTKVLYPTKKPGTLGLSGYQDETGRTDLIISESTFTCNTYYLERAFNNRTYGYQFSVPPALHGQDVPYTFFNGANKNVASDSTAEALQEYITSFAISGSPSGSGLPLFPIFGNDSQIINFSGDKISQIMDPVANARCLYWQKELYA